MAIDKEKYLKCGGYCPYCGSSNIMAGPPDFPAANSIIQEVTCNDCDKDWCDEYTLTGIIEDV